VLRAEPVSYFVLVKSQDPKGKFELTQDIPTIAGDGLAYGVACL
jgi:hypothetical protein